MDLKVDRANLSLAINLVLTGRSPIYR